MKTSKMQTRVLLSIIISQIKKQAASLTIFCVAVLFVIEPVGAQVNGDHLFPNRGKSMITVATGIPYIGVAEYAYGFSDRFSVGIVVGSTPIGPGYGMRVRGILHQKNETFRVYAKSTILYYPKNIELGKEPWVLAWPSISGEWKLDSGKRWSIGGGVVAASCIDVLLGRENNEHSHATNVAEGHHAAEDEVMSGVWNTVHAGLAIPLSDKMMFHSEASLVMDGLKIAGDDWVGGPPVVLVLGVTYTF